MSKPNIKDYLKLIRVNHYIKNMLVLFPLFFSGQFFDLEKLTMGIIAFACFCFISSSVYIINDLQDLDKDRLHPTKRKRPLASGCISKRTAITILIILMFLGFFFSVVFGGVISTMYLMLYWGLNIAYSMGLKDKVIIDIVILASGFVIRVFYGGAFTHIEISKWLYLVVITAAFYFGLGKRRNELKRHKGEGTRDVLCYYNVPFLDKNMYVCVSLANVFYALWTKDASDGRMIWTVPLIIIILMRYSYDIESDSDADPVEVLFHDRMLIVLVFIYVACIFLLLYKV